MEGEGLSRCCSAQVLDDDGDARGAGGTAWDGDFWVDTQAQHQLVHMLEVAMQSMIMCLFVGIPCACVCIPCACVCVYACMYACVCVDSVPVHSHAPKCVWGCKNTHNLR